MNNTRFHSPLPLRFLTSYIFFLFSIEVLTTSLSLLHMQINAWSARLILAAALAVFLLLFFLGTNRLGKSLIDLFRQKGWIFFAAFLAFSALVYVILWLAAWIMPDLSWDGNAYHIPTIAMWNMRGYVHWVSTTFREPIINGYPKGAELLAYVIVKAFSSSLINTTNLFFLPLGVAGIAYLSLYLGASPMLSLCAGTAFLLLPVNIYQSVSTYVDTAFASCAVGVLALAACLCSPGRPVWRNIAAFGAVIGLAVSVKSTGLALGGLAGLAVAVYWIKGSLKLPSLLHRNFEHTGQGNLKVPLITGLLVILLFSAAGGGYWYIRNIIHTGSPLYPVGVSIAGHVIFPGESVSQAIASEHNTNSEIKNMSAVLQVLNTWAQGLKAWPASIKGYDARLGGLGFLWLFGCLPAVLTASIINRRFSSDLRRALLLLLLVVGLTFLLTPLNWWARYTIWIYALGLPVFAMVVNRSFLDPVVPRPTRIFAGVWILVCLGLLIFEAAYSTRDVIALASPGPLHSQLANLFKPGVWDWPPAYLYKDMENTPIQDILSQEENVALGPRGDMEFGRYSGLVGELSQPIGARRLIFLDEKPDFSRQDPLAGTKYVLWDESVRLPAGIQERSISSTNAAGFIILTMP